MPLPLQCLRQSARCFIPSSLTVPSGYATFFANASDYAYTLLGQPRSWTIVPAVRHAMTENPHSTYFFHLTANALIMEPNLSLTSHVLEPSRLDSLMIRDMPVVPPDSIIKTFSYLKPNNVQFIVTQDAEDLVSDSFIIKQGDWGRFFLDVWYDPLYRSYDFLKAEKHALVSLFLDLASAENVGLAISGSHCAVACNNPRQTCSGPAARHQCLQQGLSRCRRRWYISERRLCHSFPWLRR